MVLSCFCVFRHLMWFFFHVIKVSYHSNPVCFCDVGLQNLCFIMCIKIILFCTGAVWTTWQQSTSWRYESQAGVVPLLGTMGSLVQVPAAGSYSGVFWRENWHLFCMDWYIMYSWLFLCLVTQYIISSSQSCLPVSAKHWLSNWLCGDRWHGLCWCRNITLS